MEPAAPELSRARRGSSRTLARRNGKFRSEGPVTQDTRQFAQAALLICLVGAAGCGAYRNLLPVTYAQSVSPDGRHRASVWQAPSIDPPADHLFLATEGR